MNILACVLLLGAFAASSLVPDIDLNRIFLLAFFLVMSLYHHFIKNRPWWFRLAEFLLIGSAFMVWAYSFVTPHYLFLYPVVVAALVGYAVAVVGWNWRQTTDEANNARQQVRRVLPWVVTAFIALAWAGHAFAPRPPRVQSTFEDPACPPAAITPPVVAPRHEDDALMEELERAKQ